MYRRAFAFEKRLYRADLEYDLGYGLVANLAVDAFDDGRFLVVYLGHPRGGGDIAVKRRSHEPLWKGFFGKACADAMFPGFYYLVFSEFGGKVEVRERREYGA